MKVAVIGTGVMGKNHARVLGSMGRLAGVFDADVPAARAVASGHHVKAFASLEALLKDPAVGAVVVATPTATHADVVERALEAAKHVLVEKPLAPDAATGHRMVERARKAGRVLAVGHIERHNPIVAYAKEALGKGEFGRAIHLSSRRVSNLPTRIRDVGVILDLGIHDIDVLAYLAGAPAKRVYAVGGAFTPGLQWEDHATLLLTFPGGVSGTVEVNWLTPTKVRRLGITASDAYAELDYIEQRALVTRSSWGAINEANVYQAPVEFQERSIQLKKREPLLNELEDFVAAAEGTRPRPLVDGLDGIAALRVAEAALASTKTGRAVDVADGKS
jgi:UDP-N-acetylglucosamine 3-dehydrogenase